MSFCAAPSRRVAFGSSADRTVFPLQYAPDRLGIEMQHGLTAPQVGPGCYDNHEYDSIRYKIEKALQNPKGYTLGARTTARFFALHKIGTPSPQQYQQDQTRIVLPPPNKTPFSSATQRFVGVKRTTDDTPGPGTYAQDAVTHKKVSWPMCFGRPDWDSLPQLKKKSLRVKLQSEKEFIERRNRVAYLSLYF